MTELYDLYLKMDYLNIAFKGKLASEIHFSHGCLIDFSFTEKKLQIVKKIASCIDCFNVLHKQPKKLCELKHFTFFSDRC